jgi:trk system potassium uptake protein TrkH
LKSLATVQRVLGILLMFFSASNLPPLALSLAMNDGMAYAFLDGLWITFTVGALVWWPVRNSRGDLKLRDGFLITVLMWAVLALFGAIPLYITDVGWPSFIDALFESTSGLTTTGATVIASGLDQLPPSINYYRCQLHWLGGMGIIVLAVAVMPMLGIGGLQLYKTETPGPMKNAKLTPRIAGTARALWTVYLSLTLCCALVYWLCGMSLFDAVCHAMSTLATGGFSTHDASIGHFRNSTLEWAVIVFMVLGTINFAVHFLVWRQRRPSLYWGDAEVRTCLALISGFTVLVCIPLLQADIHPDFPTALRMGLFHVVSFGTTSGFTLTDSSVWPAYVPLMLVVSSFMIGCAGSTSGGVKVLRVMLFARQALRELYLLIHPRAEAPIKLHGRVVPDKVVYAIGGFFSIYIFCTLILTFVMMTTGLDAITAFSAVAACINNLGPGLGSLSASMATVTDTGKAVLIFTMLLGRLEIFSLLIVFMPGFWRR